MGLDPLFPFWLIAVVILALTILFVWQEWKKPHRLRMLRTISVVMMMTALFGIALRPKYSTNKSADIVLLTPNYSRKQVDSLVRQNPRLNIMHFNNSASYKNSKPLADYLINVLDQRILYVLGDGVHTNVLDMMDTKNFVFIPSPLPTGVTALSVSAINVLHRKNVVSGTFRNAGGRVWLYLSGPGGN